MPQDLFKWEDGGGLKHHCPICQTPLSHDKCRTVCLGNHVEWCHRYHCLFRKNWSSRCSACKTTDEQHEKRHREIADILSKIRKHKAEEEALAMELLASPLTPKTPRTPLTIRALNSVSGPPIGDPGLEVPKATKKERKAAKKAVKAMERDKVVTTADIQVVAKTLHPSEKSEEQQLDDLDAEETSEDMEIKMNLKFNNSTCNTKSARHDFIKKDRVQLDVDEAELGRILEAFEVDAKASGKEGELVGELVEAIKNDLVHFHNELKLVARLRAGFWRWANKRQYRNLQDNGKEWDAKHHWDRDESNAALEDRRDSEASVETEPGDDTEGSRHGSISSVAESAGTALTVPSSKGSSKKKPAVLTFETPAPKRANEDPGWTRVGKKVLKPPVGKLTLSSNGGLHHLSSKPKNNFWALSRKGDDDD